MQSWPTSGYINTPPGTQRDYEIAAGMLLSAGLTSKDPANGATMKPARPESYTFETKGPGIIAGLAVCIVVMVAVTGLRLYLRFFGRGLKWGMDDILIIPALIMAVAYPSLQIAMVQYGGAGKHIFDVSYEQYFIHKMLANVAQIDFFVGVGIIKLSITVFNIRLTSMSSRAWRIATWTFFTLCLIYTIVAFLMNLLQCSPFGSSFDLLLVQRAGKVPECIGVSNMNTILRVINIILDYCLLTVPLIIISKVQMSTQKRVKLIILFCVGGLACIGSVMTLVSKFRLKEDNTWNYTGILGWSLVELVLGVLAASLPTLACLLPSRLRSTRQYHFTSNENQRYQRSRSANADLNESGLYETRYSTNSEGQVVMKRQRKDAASDTVAIVAESESEFHRSWSHELDDIERPKKSYTLRRSESNGKIEYLCEPTAEGKL